MASFYDLSPPDLDHISPQWWKVIDAHSKGIAVSKDDALAALADDSPIPDEAKPFLAAVIAGDYQFRRGTKPHWATERPESHWHTAMMVDGYQHWIEEVAENPDNLQKDADPEKKAMVLSAAEAIRTKRKGAKTAYQAAVDMVAWEYDASPALVRRWLRDWRALTGKCRAAGKIRKREI